MKIYKDKDGRIIIVAGKEEKAPVVIIAKDDGEKSRNMFGEKLDRFAYHWASVWNNTAYTSRTNCLIDEEDEAYQYKLVRVKKIKRLGKKNRSEQR